MSRTPLLLDEEGWREVQKCLADALKGVLKAQKKASTRLSRATSEDGFNACVSLLGFELPEAPSRRKKATKGKGRAKVGAKSKAKAKAKKRK
jgi:hypothetical protein